MLAIVSLEGTSPSAVKTSDWLELPETEILVLKLASAPLSLETAKVSLVSSLSELEASKFPSLSFLNYHHEN